MNLQRNFEFGVIVLTDETNKSTLLSSERQAKCMYYVGQELFG